MITSPAESFTVEAMTVNMPQSLDQAKAEAIMAYKGQNIVGCVQAPAQVKNSACLENVSNFSLSLSKTDFFKRHKMSVELTTLF